MTLRMFLGTCLRLESITVKLFGRDSNGLLVLLDTDKLFGDAFDSYYECSVRTWSFDENSLSIEIDYVDR